MEKPPGSIQPIAFASPSSRRSSNPIYHSTSIRMLNKECNDAPDMMIF
jgi:hypothetical protein